MQIISYVMESYMQPNLIKYDEKRYLSQIVVSGNNKLPRNTKMFLFPVLYISNTFLSILADPSSADFRIEVIDVSTPISFKLPFNRNGTVPKAPNTIGTTLVFTSHIIVIGVSFIGKIISAYINIIAGTA